MPTAVSMLEAFGQNFPGLTRLLTMLAYLIGMWAGASVGLLLWRRQRFEASVTHGALLMRVGLCAILLYLPTAISTGQETVFASPNIVSYSPGSVVSEHGKVVLDTVIRWVQLVGLWAFIWGWVLLNRAHLRGYEPGLGGQGLAHVVGGILCINIVATLQGLAQSLGLETLLTYLLVPG